MSRLYECRIRVENIPDLKEASNIVAAIDEETEICEDDMRITSMGANSEPPYECYGSGNVALCGGISEEDWVENLLEAMYRAMSEYRPVDVGMVCLEYLPVESYSSDEDVFNEVKKEQEAARMAEEIENE